jgi:hypothetical protein
MHTEGSPPPVLEAQARAGWVPLAGSAALLAVLVVVALALSGGCGSCQAEYEARRYDPAGDCLRDPEPVKCADHIGCEAVMAVYRDPGGNCFLFVCDPGAPKGWRAPAASDQCNVGSLLEKSRCQGE